MLKTVHFFHMWLLIFENHLFEANVAIIAAFKNICLTPEIPKGCFQPDTLTAAEILRGNMCRHGSQWFYI